MKLHDLKIIVSGGASGMGRHFALRLAESGAQVAIGDINDAGLAGFAMWQAGGDSEDILLDAINSANGDSC